MMKRIAQLAGLTLLLGVMFVPAAQASPHFSFSLRVGPSAYAAPYWRGRSHWERERYRSYDRGGFWRHDRDRRDYRDDRYWRR